MRSDLNPFLRHKKDHIFVKFAISFLLAGLAFRLLFWDTLGFSSVVESPSVAERETESLVVSLPPPAPDSVIEDTPFIPEEQKELSAISFPPHSTDSVHFLGNETQTPQNVKCDIFVGEWIADPSGPLYNNESCGVIESHQNCMKNGRPDWDYLYWRWKPRDCELPRFDPHQFLQLMRNKYWAFIGDSILRNHVQSLLCILSQVEPAEEVYHDKEYRSKRWHFPTYNYTISVVWTPFLIKADVFEDMNGVSSSEIQLHLDHLDEKWTENYKNFDYVVIAGGKWYLKTTIYHEDNTTKGCHYCPGKNLTELGFEYAYRKALHLVFDFIVNSDHETTVFFRTTTPDHFENGAWFSGGYCNRTLPYKEGDQVDMLDVDIIMRNIEVEEFVQATKVGSQKGVELKLLDTTGLSFLRPDGHPGPYRTLRPFAGNKNGKVQNDCLHWCLPGPIDSWNDLMMEMLINGR